MLGNLKGWELIALLVLALILFGGAKKLPEAARGLGRSLRIFKAETKGLVSDDEPDLGPADRTEAGAGSGTAAYAQPQRALEAVLLEPTEVAGVSAAPKRTS